MIVHLKPDELQLLANAPELPPRIRERLLAAAEGGRVAELELSRGEAIETGDALTELLVREGFDADYSLTKEGGRIDILIDKSIVD